MRLMLLPRCLLVGILLAPLGCKKETPAPPATKPTTQASTKPAPKPPTTSYVEVIREHYPKVPATKPLESGVDLRDAGHYLLNEPVYLCPRGDLWITRPDAPPIAQALAKADKEQTHLIRERVRYVQWSADDEGKPLERAVIVTADGKDAWIDGEKITPTLQSGYRWDRAIAYGDGVVVPTARGVSVFTFTPDLKEIYQEIVKETGANPPCVLADPRGVLAWSPWEGKSTGGASVWRWVDDQWSDLGAKDPNWAAHFMHLVPLLDGSVLQIIQKDAGKIGLALSPLDAPQIDETVLGSLVEQLSDDDPDKRQAAFAQLTRYGPPSWPYLEKMRNDQPPEARVRIEQLLKNRIQPTLGGRTLIDGSAKLVSRFEDGGILLYAQAGVSIPQQDQKPLIVKPAWLSVRPGHAIELAEPALVVDANPDKQKVYAFDNEWIIADNVQGPRRLFGNHLETMLEKSEAAFTNVIGYDRRGRWLFTKPGDASATLILDPTLPDPNPRLPVWLMFIDKGSVGWTTEGWPVIKRGGAWALTDQGWRALDESKERMITKLVRPDEKVMLNVPRIVATTQTTQPATRAAATHPATTIASTTSATTNATTEPAGDPILVDRDGRKWFDGRESLRVVEKDGKVTEWLLPPNAVGASDVSPVLLRTTDGTLYLLNTPGRVVRIKPTPGAAEPFAIEAVFTNRIPNSDRIMRIWLDPADRIIIAYENNRLAVMFTQGRIPPHIAVLIPAKEMDQKP